MPITIGASIRITDLGSQSGSIASGNCFEDITLIDKYTLVDGDCIEVIDAYALTPDAGYDIIDKYTT